MRQSPKVHEEIPELCLATFISKDKVPGYLWAVIIILLSAVTWALSVESRQASIANDVSHLQQMDKKLDVIIGRLP